MFNTELQKHFKVLERYHMPVHKQNKVESLVEKWKNNHPEFKLEVGICRSQNDTFIGAITYLKTAVACIFLEGKKVGRPSRQISSARVNGIDLTDFKKHYSKEEINKIKSTKEGKQAWYVFLNDSCIIRNIGKGKTRIQERLKLWTRSSRLQRVQELMAMIVVVSVMHRP